MAIEKALNRLPSLEVVIGGGIPEPQSDIEIVIEEDGGATVEMGEKDAEEVDFYANLADVIDPDDMVSVGLEVAALFEADKGSRSEWESMYAKGLDLLGFRMEERTKPFRGAAGATHPMLTEAIIQFQAQAFKELMPAGGPVRSQIMGKETVEKFQQAGRVQDFMNYQLTTVMEEYTPEFDQQLFYTGYGGSTFKKVYYDYQLGRMVSKLCLADDVYIPYNGSSVVSQCPRLTHRIAMDSNEYKKRALAGEYLDVVADTYATPTDPSQIQAAVDKITGIQPTTDVGEVFLLEQLVDLDIPGFEDLDEDGNPTGVKLPYVVTLVEDSLKVVGIRRNWKEEDKKRLRRNYYVHYVLVEGPGAYGLGFVHLIGGLGKAATSALRQLIDAGTLSNLPAGFKAKGARIADDSDPIQPGEWRDIDAGGAELSASLMPLPYKEPSQTLFALLGFLVEAGKRLSSTADMQIGDGNQYAQVGTTLALLERGSMVMSSIHKRLHYAQTLEFRLLFEGFGQYMPDEYPYEVPGASRKIKKADFNTMVSVQPVADPNIFSSAQRIQIAQMQLQLAQSAPNMHNMYEAYYRMYAALNIRDIDGVLLPQNTNSPRDPASENSDVLNGMKLKAFAGQQHDAHIATHLMMGLSPILQANPISASELQKHILDHVRLKAEEDVEVELFKAYGNDPDRMVSAIQKEGMVAIKIAVFMQEVRKMQDEMAGGDEGPDPLIKLKETEIQQRAQNDQAKIAIDQKRLALDQQKQQENMQLNRQKLQLQQSKINQPGGQYAA
ncbi:hypothetical protein UFOVP652_57 [uncultured Caudovirales phage]|uniref:Uncharacterized protein n=1 Tax=uncultured Caudovirales phage TaxID=2100421 RepID=A0A6J5NHW3_9CAUD|nr:hypothetical protein UFOVP652_57 [uncultured Caudovirales phage]CAB5224399.1 hypothetical protein UFOVP734_67 [uncultured Caudovirales phage]